jgi:predicted CoA-binding protein
MPEPDLVEARTIRRLLGTSRIAIVGLSSDARTPSRLIARYLLSRGRVIVPVNPTIPRVMDLKSWESLAEIPEPPLLAVVFRKAEYCTAVVQDAIKAGVAAVWLQQGITSRNAKRLARDHGITYVEDRCIKTEMMMSRH